MKIAVVTGAAGGLGRAICASLVADGLHVVGLDVTAEPLLAMQASSLTAIPVDLTDNWAVAKVFADIGRTFEGVDALVNCAGTCFMSDFPNIPASELNLQMSVNFNSAFYCCQAAVPLMSGRSGVRRELDLWQCCRCSVLFAHWRDFTKAL